MVANLTFVRTSKTTKYCNPPSVFDILWCCTKTFVMVWKHMAGLQPWWGWQRDLRLGSFLATTPPLALELKNAPSNKCTYVHKGGVHTYHVCTHTRRLPSSYGPPAHGGNYGHIVGTSCFQFGRSIGVLTSLFMSFAAPPFSLNKWQKVNTQIFFFLFVIDSHHQRCQTQNYVELKQNDKAI